MVDALRPRLECREHGTKAIGCKWRVVEVVKGAQRGRGSGNCCWNITWCEVSRQRSQRSTRQIRGKSGLLIEPDLGRQADGVSSKIANFDARVLIDLVLHTEAPAKHFRFDLVGD